MKIAITTFRAHVADESFSFGV